MNDLQIEYFLAVADSLNFTKAASGKYVSQPAVSRQIRLMEDELGVPLFVRCHNNIQLTKAGALYADFFRRQRTQLQELSIEAKGLVGKEPVPLTIAFGSAWTLAHFLPDVLRDMTDPEQETTVSIRCHDFHRLESLLLEDAVDAIITLIPDIHTIPMIESKVLTEIRNVIIYSDRHALAGKTSLTPRDFRNETFLIPLPYESEHIAKLVTGYVEPYDFVPAFRNVSNIESMYANVANGTGIGIVDEWATFRLQKDIRTLPIESKSIVVAEWKKQNRSVALEHFLGALFKHFGV